MREQLPKEAETVIYPADPKQVLDEHKRRTAIDVCFGVVQAGARSGKSMAQRFKGALKNAFSKN